MSRNIGKTDCYFCDGDVQMTEAPRDATRGDVGRYYDASADGFGFAGMVCANAECVDCEAKYLAWVSLKLCAGYGAHPRHEDPPFFDLSFRSTFNDEPGESDMPKWRIMRGIVSKTKFGGRMSPFSGVTRAVIDASGLMAVLDPAIHSEVMNAILKRDNDVATALGVGHGDRMEPDDRYADMTREQLDADMQARVESLADALAFARSAHLHDDEIRRVLLLLDLARKGEC